MFNEDSFVYIASFGIFTEVSYSTKQEIKNVLGHMAYILEGMKSLYNLKSYKMKVSCDEIEFEGDFLFGIFQGMCLLPKQVFLCVIIEIIAVLIFVLILVLAKKFDKNKRIPFIPFMSVGLVLSSLPFPIN